MLPWGFSSLSSAWGSIYWTLSKSYIIWTCSMFISVWWNHALLRTLYHPFARLPITFNGLCPSLNSLFIQRYTKLWGSCRSIRTKDTRLALRVVIELNINVDDMHLNLKSTKIQLYQSWFKNILRRSFKNFCALVVYQETSEWCDDKNMCCLYAATALNMYGSFNHTAVITYWCVDNYG